MYSLDLNIEILKKPFHQFRIRFSLINRNNMTFKRFALLLLLSVFTSQLSAQVHLRITSLSRFPVAPTDTAFESLVYDSIQSTVENIGNSVLVDNVSIFLRANPANQQDTIYDDSTVYTLQAGTSISIMSNGYRPKPTHFDDGDNIVVVWPAARTTPYTCDTLTFHVYFVSLINGIKLAENPIHLGPNPVNDHLLVQIEPKNFLQQVRILDMLGNEILVLSPGQNFISTANWTAGIYFLETTNQNGTTFRRKIVKE